MKLNLSGMRVTVMGLGVHGGGLSAARYATDRGATVTVTDLRDERALRESLDQLPPGCRIVLGTHEEEDFQTCDLVVKNPAVPRTARYLEIAPAVTSDIALFFGEWTVSGGDDQATSQIQRSPDHLENRGIAETDMTAGTRAPRRTPHHLPLVTVTGTKGKSTTSSAIAHVLRSTYPATRLGGNITVSPLTFLEDIDATVPVVLELSSFQLGDLAFFRAHNGRAAARLPGGLPEGVFFPTVPATVAVITNIYEDHQDYYGSMESYVADKREIYHDLPAGAALIIPGEGPWTARFLADIASRGEAVSTWTITAEEVAESAGRDLIPEMLPLPGLHNRINLAMAARAAAHIGVPPATVRSSIATFPGVPHRMETVRRIGAVRFVNDTAATIPEAAEAAVLAYAGEASTGAVHLIAGGSEKGLDPGPLVAAIAASIASGGQVVLLDGSATERIETACRTAGVHNLRRFPDLAAAVRALAAAASEVSTHERARTADPRETVVLLSPGCASFGMFQNEFDRGRRFIEIVNSLPG